MQVLLALKNEKVNLISISKRSIAKRSIAKRSIAKRSIAKRSYVNKKIDKSIFLLKQDR